MRDIAGNGIYVLLSAFVIFLTDTVGLNTGIVGTLIVREIREIIGLDGELFVQVLSHDAEDMV